MLTGLCSVKCVRNFSIHSDVDMGRLFSNERGVVCRLWKLLLESSCMPAGLIYYYYFNMKPKHVMKELVFRLSLLVEKEMEKKKKNNCTTNRD